MGQLLGKLVPCKPTYNCSVGNNAQSFASDSTAVNQVSTTVTHDSGYQDIDRSSIEMHYDMSSQNKTHYNVVSPVLLAEDEPDQFVPYDNNERQMNSIISEQISQREMLRGIIYDIAQIRNNNVNS